MIAVMVDKSGNVFGAVSVAGIDDEEIMLRYPGAVVVDRLDEPLPCYEVVDGELRLRDDWESIRAGLEARDEAEPKVNLSAKMRRYIYTHYPQEKQNSDLADKLYYETLLKASGVEGLEADIVARTERFFGGENLEDVLSDIDEANRTAYEQLLKVAIRVAWVQRCKAELAAALAEVREPNYPEYPL